MATTSSCVFELRPLITLNDSSLHLNSKQEFARYGSLEKEREEAIALIREAHGWIATQSICDRPPEWDHVWDEWHAAYLLLERDADGAASDFRYVPTADKINSRKRKYDGTLAYEGTQEISGQMMDVKEDIVVPLAISALMAFNDWPALESIVGKIVCDGVQKNMFDCFAKFILSILDEEDMERMFFSEQLREENKKFYSEICKRGLFADFASGKLGRDNFPHLMESDFYEAHLNFRLREFKELIITGIPEVKHSELTVEFSSRASKIIQEHRPLKWKLRAQVLMEHTCMKGFHVTDVLILEAVNGLRLPELSEMFLAGLSAVDAEKLSKLLGDLAETMLKMTCKISNMKAQQAIAAEWKLLHPFMVSSCRYRFEVYDLLRIANYERRMENERFLTLSHIFTALRCSRVSVCVPNLSKDASDRPSSELLVYRLGEQTANVARILGDYLGALEHLVVAIRHGVLDEWGFSILDPIGQYFESLVVCKRSFEPELKIVDVFTAILERRCRAKHVLKLNGRELIVKLDKDLKSGRLVLPCYDDLRVPLCGF